MKFKYITIEREYGSGGTEIAKKVAEKCGMTFEGTKREYFKAAAGEFLDISFWSILKRDWMPTC